jgi:predicted small lipoprotein YifL
MRSALMLATLLGIGLLAACGKKGPPSPPGPPEQITYPRAYPTY